MSMYLLRALFLVGICGVTACNNGSGTAPDGLEGTYTGEWSGATSQGGSVAFSVSAQNIVTFLTIGHDFNGCRGTQRFSSLSIAIGQSGLPGRLPTYFALEGIADSNPGFGYGSGSPEAPNFVQLTGQFQSGQAANGTVTFLNFEKCGNTLAHWNATKR